VWAGKHVDEEKEQRWQVTHKTIAGSYEQLGFEIIVKKGVGAS
jgi:hypothetical protein